MKNKIMFLMALVANVAPLSLGFFYHKGALLLYPMMVVIHMILYRLNRVAAKTKFQLVFLGITHIIVTICTHQLVGWLYLNLVFDDPEGRAIFILGTLVSAIWTTHLHIESVSEFKSIQKSTE
ncbi:MAG: hypothetical protein IJD86_09005 [Clostridia bacterium]|nr:hypothetical protein [Clostridia bacterium]